MGSNGGESGSVCLWGVKSPIPMTLKVQASSLSIPLADAMAAQRRSRCRYVMEAVLVSSSCQIYPPLYPSGRCSSPSSSGLLPQRLDLPWDHRFDDIPWCLQLNVCGGGHVFLCRLVPIHAVGAPPPEVPATNNQRWPRRREYSRPGRAPWP